MVQKSSQNVKKGTGKRNVKGAGPVTSKARTKPELKKAKAGKPKPSKSSARHKPMEKTNGTTTRARARPQEKPEGTSSSSKASKASRSWHQFLKLQDHHGPHRDLSAMTSRVRSVMGPSCINAIVATFASVAPALAQAAATQRNHSIQTQTASCLRL